MIKLFLLARNALGKRRAEIGNTISVAAGTEIVFTAGNFAVGARTTYSDDTGCRDCCSCGIISSPAPMTSIVYPCVQLNVVGFASALEHNSFISSNRQNVRGTSPLKRLSSSTPRSQHMRLALDTGLSP